MPPRWMVQEAFQWNDLPTLPSDKLPNLVDSALAKLILLLNGFLANAAET